MVRDLLDKLMGKSKENFAKSKKSQNSHEEHFENCSEKQKNRNYSNFSKEKKPSDSRLKTTPKYVVEHLEKQGYDTSQLVKKFPHYGDPKYNTEIYSLKFEGGQGKENVRVRGVYAYNSIEAKANVLDFSKKNEIPFEIVLPNKRKTNKNLE